MVDETKLVVGDYLYFPATTMANNQPYVAMVTERAQPHQGQRTIKVDGIGWISIAEVSFFARLDEEQIRIATKAEVLLYGTTKTG